MASTQLCIAASKANRQAAEAHPEALSSKLRKRLTKKGKPVTVSLPGDKSVGKRLQLIFPDSEFVS